MNMVRWGVLIGCLCLGTGCFGTRGLSLRHAYSLDLTPPPGSDIFQKAWSDGCGSGLAGLGSQMIKQGHSFRYDGNLYDHPLYARMWDASSMFCRTYVFVGDEHFTEEFEQQSAPLGLWNP